MFSYKSWFSVKFLKIWYKFILLKQRREYRKKISLCHIHQGNKLYSLEFICAGNLFNASVSYLHTDTCFSYLHIFYLYWNNSNKTKMFCHYRNIFWSNIWFKDFTILGQICKDFFISSIKVLIVLIVIIIDWWMRAAIYYNFISLFKWSHKKVSVTFLFYNVQNVIIKNLIECTRT